MRARAGAGTALVVLVVLLVAGCSVGRSAPVAAIRSTPSPSVSQATPTLYASVISAADVGVLYATAAYNTHGCAAMYLRGPALSTDSARRACVASLEGMANGAGLLHTAIAMAPNAIGSPPPELTTLIARTDSAVTAVKAAAPVVGRCTSQCAAVTRAFDSALGDMTAALAAWKPYGA